MKIYCPKCNQELIPLEPYERDGLYEYWCNICDLDIQIIDHKEEESEKESN